MVDNCKITIEFQGKTITFEGPASFVSEQTERYLTFPSKQEVVIEKTATYSPSNPRDLVTEKQPKGHHEVVAVLAFGLSEAGLEEFTEADMRRAYIQAGVRPPKVVSQAIRDAKSKYDYIEPGKRRGTYRLSPHGDRTVRFDLPKNA